MAHPPILVEAERLEHEGKHKEAAALYDRLLAQNEDNAILLAAAACPLMHDPDTVGLAIVLFLVSIRLHKERGEKPPIEALVNLGVAYKHSGQYDKAKHWFEKACELEPNHPGALSNYGCMFVESDTPEKGTELLERAVKADPSLAMAHWNLSLCLIAEAHKRDNWKRSWEEYEWGQHEGGMRVKKKFVPLPDWDGTKGQKVMVYGEQGIGDEIMFASMLPDLMRDAGEVILDCHPRLTTLFEKSFGLKCYPTRKEKELDWLDVEKPDAMISIGSLGKFYRTKRADFTGAPYLKAEAAPRGEKFRVGISWTGGRMAKRVATRTVPLSWWDSILMNDCEFVSLQYTDGAQAEIDSLRAKFGHDVRQEPAATAQDYYELAKFVKSCDLVISVCTSVIHLAGALGVPCWVMVPRHPAWRYQNSGPMPWYRSVRLYRQPEADAGAWIPVVQKVALDLSELVSQRSRKAA